MKYIAMKQPFLAGPTKLGRLQSIGQTQSSTWSSRLGSGGMVLLIRGGGGGGGSLRGRIVGGVI